MIALNSSYDDGCYDQIAQNTINVDVPNFTQCLIFKIIFSKDLIKQV